MGSNIIAVRRNVMLLVPSTEVFDYVSDYDNVLQFMHNVRRFEPTTSQSYGLGARFYWETVLRGIKLGWEFAVTEFRPHETMAAQSLSRPRSASRWHFRRLPEGTDAVFAVECELPPTARFGRWLVERELAHNVERSLTKLKTLLEP